MSDRRKRQRKETNFEAMQRVQRDNAHHRLSNIRLVAAVESGVKGVAFEHKATWPSSEGAACWHCCHPFDWPPVGMPVRHNTLRDNLVLRGNFCSLNCCKTHMRTEGRPRRDSEFLLEMLALRTIRYLRLGGEPIPRHMVIRAAPPRTALKMFGGFMTIDEFRANILTVEPIALLEPCKKVTWEGVVSAIRGVTVQNGVVESAVKQQQRQQQQRDSSPDRSHSKPNPIPAVAQIPPRVPKNRCKTLDRFVKKRK